VDLDGVEGAEVDVAADLVGVTARDADGADLRRRGGDKRVDRPTGRR